MKMKQKCSLVCTNEKCVLYNVQYEEYIYFFEGKSKNVICGRCSSKITSITETEPAVQV